MENRQGYTRPVEFTKTNLYGCGEGDDVYTVAEFLDCVKNKLFIDYDGHGNPVKDNLANTSIVIKPSTAHLTIPADATHIIWYNR